MNDERNPATEHYLQVMESRSRVFRIMYDTIIEAEGADEDQTYDILCHNIGKICDARICALLSCDPATRTFRLRSIFAEGKQSSEFNRNPVEFDAEFENIITAYPLIEDFEDGHPACVDGLLRDLASLCSQGKCSAFSCVRDNELLAFGIIHLEPNHKLKTKDLIEAYLKMASMILQRVNALRTLKEQAVQLEEWNRELTRRVDEQLAELQRMSRLKRFLPPQIADLVISSGEDRLLESHRRNITVLFCDLRGFTAFSETAEPEDVIGVLREYHETVGPLTFRLGGTIESFIGDGIMVFFNDPVPCPDPPGHAVELAIGMRTLVEELSKKWGKLGFQLGFGIGIAEGYATLGMVGFDERMEYSAIGSVANLASRLCGEAKDGQILISQRIGIAVEERVELEPLGELALKGFHHPIPAFNVRGRKST